MKYINTKKMMALLLSGIIIFSVAGCQMKKEDFSIEENPQYTSSMSSAGFDVGSVLDEVNKEETATQNQEKVLEEVDKMNNELDSLLHSDNFEKVKDKAKEYAINVMDYILGYTSIHGVYFRDLPGYMKDKIFAIAALMDSKLEIQYPGYKATVKTKSLETYEFMSDKFHQGVLYIDSKLEKNFDTNTSEIIDKVTDTVGGAYQDVKDSVDSKLEDKYNTNTGELYEQGKEIIKDDVESLGDAAKSGFQKFKNWYEEKRK